MNLISRGIACLLLLLGSTTFGQIPWVGDPNDAARIAQQTGKPILLHFYTEDCPPCKMLEYRAFRDADFVKILSDSVVPVKVNADEQREFTANYGVTRWPTDVYLFPDGSELHRTVCPQDPSVYREVIQRVALRCRDHQIEIDSRRAPEKSDTQVKMEGSRNSAENPSNSQKAPATENKTAAKTASHKMPSRVSHEPPKHSARELPTFESTAPNHMSVASYRQDMDARPASDSNGNAADQTDSSADKPKVNRYRSQSANFSSSFNGSIPNPAQSVPSQVLSPFVNQPNNQTQPPSQMSTVSQQKSLLTRDGGAQNNPPQISVAADEIIAIDGYCPVILDEKRWELGNAQFAVRHRGKIYHCSSEAARAAFLADPDRYSPMLSGYDIVRFLESGQVVSGKRQFGCWFGGRVYLFESEMTRQIFDQNVDRYLQQLQSLQASAGRVASESSEAVYR